MKTTTSVKSGGFRYNHNHAAAGVKVKTSIKSGDGTVSSGRPGGGKWLCNHNQSLAGVKVQSNVKAGPIEIRELVIKVNVNESQR